MINWPTKKLGEICEIIAGQAPPSNSYNTDGKGMPFLRVNSFREIYPQIEGWTTQPLKCSKKGDILLSVAGSVGMVNLGIDACITRSIFALRPNNKFLNQRFLFLVLRLKSNKLLHIGQGSAQKIITINQVNNLETSLPPIPIQQKIVKILDAIQEAIEVQERLIEKTKELKKSLMAEIFNSKVKSQKSKLQFKIQKWIKLGKIAKIERGKFAHRPRNDSAYYGGSIPFVQTGDVSLSNGHIKKYHQTLNKKGLSVSRVFPQGTIVITIAANIGYSAILDFDSAFPDSLIGITPNKEIDSEFLNYYLSSQQEKMDEISARGTQKNINIEFLRPWPIPSLSLNKQCEIAKILQTIDQKIEIEQKKKTLYGELFKTMLNKIMKQEIDVEKIKLQ